MKILVLGKTSSGARQISDSGLRFAKQNFRDRPSTCCPRCGRLLVSEAPTAQSTPHEL